MKSAHDRDPGQRALAAILAAYVAVALLYVATVPVWEATDEFGHFSYVKHLRDHRALPYQPADPRQLVLSHWFHPPLYYALGALATAWIDVSDLPAVARPNPHFQWAQGAAPGGWNVFLPVERDGSLPRGAVLAVYVLRLLSVAMGAGVVWMTHRLARLLLPGQPAVALGAAGLAAFDPAFVYMTSGVHNDSLATLLGTAVVLWSASAIVGRPPRRRGLILGGALVGLAALAKTSELVLVPVAVAAAGASAWLGSRLPSPYGQAPATPVEPESGSGPLRRRAHLASALGAGAVTLAAAVAVAGWWYLRNVQFYGDPLAWQRYMTTHAFLARTGPYDLGTFRDFLAQLARTYWAAFGYMNLVADRPVYYALWAGTLLAGLGLVRLALGGRLQPDVLKRWPGWLLGASALTLYFASLVRYSATLGGVGHGRLLFPVIAVASLFLAVGLYQLPPRPLAGPALGGAVLGLAILAAACPLAYVLPAYAVPRPVPAESVPLTPGAGATFGGQLRLVGWEVTPEQVQPGAAARVRLFWQAVASAGPDLLVSLRLRDREGSVLYQAEGRPLGAHLPTDRWRAGDVYEDVYAVEVPARAYTGLSPLEVGVRPPSGEPLPAADAQGRALGTSLLVARVGIADGGRSAVAGSPETEVGHPLRVTLGDRVRLLGFDLPSATVRPGESLRLTLHWRAERPIAENYTVFAHLAGAGDRPVAQRDAEPRDRAYPTSVWRVGEVVDDPYEIPVPAGTTPGRYRLLVGMYLNSTGARLPAALDGARGGADYVELAEIDVR